MMHGPMNIKLSMWCCEFCWYLR